MTEPPYFVIWSIEHSGWWRASLHGYADTLAEAGRFTGPQVLAILSAANVREVNECAIPVEALQTQPSIVCPFCGFRSFNPTDIREQYCGVCHRFARDL